MTRHPAIRAGPMLVAVAALLAACSIAGRESAPHAPTLPTLAARLHATQTVDAQEQATRISALEPTAASARSTANASIETRCRVYDADPNHLWNRLFCALYARVDRDGNVLGIDDLDTLHWYETRHLKEDRSHRAAVGALDAFLSGSGEQRIVDLVKRAFLQRDLWAIYDWLTYSDHGADGTAKRDALQQRIVAVMRRVALSRTQIAALPDTFEAAIRYGGHPTAFNRAAPRQPFLPPDLFDPAGPWIMLGGRPSPIADFHVGSALGARSVWLVFIRVPGREPDVRANTRAFVEALQRSAQPARPSGADAIPPTVPTGTELALVRRMLLIDDAGHIVPSPIVESVQLRHFSAAATGASFAPYSHDFFEWDVHRAALFTAPAGGLVPVGPSGRAFVFLNPGPFDDFENDEAEPRNPEEPPGFVVLDQCESCHSGRGALSINSYSQNFSSGPRRELIESTPAVEAAQTAAHRASQDDWPAFLAYWASR